jgi:hypothetical protein
MKTKSEPENGRPPTRPLSFRQVVTRALRDPAFARQLRQWAAKANAGDPAARAQISQWFKLTPAELKTLQLPDDFDPLRVCTIPTFVPLVGFLAFIRPRKKKKAK